MGRRNVAALIVPLDMRACQDTTTCGRPAPTECSRDVSNPEHKHNTPTTTSALPLTEGDAMGAAAGDNAWPAALMPRRERSAPTPIGQSLARSQKAAQVRAGGRTRNEPLKRGCCSMGGRTRSAFLTLRRARRRTYKSQPCALAHRLCEL